MRSCRAAFVFAALAALLVLAGPATAQLISLKTVPLATGDQFQLFPSERPGVGGGLALADRFQDPFSRPASGALLEGLRVFGSPVLYDYANESGGGLTLPAGAFVSGGRFFGGVAGAIQELRPTQVAGNWPFVRTNLDIMPDGPYLPASIRDDSRVNTYAFGLLGVRLGDADAVAVSGFGAWLEAVQGIEEMYAGNAGIVQDGWLADVRLGWLHDLDRGGSLELVLLHSYLDMTHDVAFPNPLAFSADPVPTGGPLPVFRWEHNPDRTRTVGGQLRYATPIDTVWDVGVVVTVNRKTHPKIPNYVIMNIPRDPGVSTAAQVGVGVARDHEGTVLAVDALLEPGWSETWAVAQEDILHSDSATVLVAAGDRSVENHFRFMNGVLRVAAARESETWTLGAGLEMRTIGYHMTQYLFDVPWWLRRQDERGIEWTPTWGTALRLPGLELRYDGRVTFGTGAGGPSWGTPRAAFPDAAGTDILAAPSGALDFDQLTVWTHQLVVSVPVR